MTINVPNTIQRLDHLRTYQLDDIVAICLLRREVATKTQKWNKPVHMFCFPMFSFSFKNEKTKIEIYSIEFSIFPILDQNCKSFLVKLRSW